VGPPTEPLPTTASRTSRLRILVVDDDPLVRTAVGRCLAEHQVTLAASAEAAMDLLDAGERYDLILCDLMMPDMNGMDLHSLLRRELPEQGRRMIFLTGGVLTSEAADFVSADHIVVDKPFSPRRLRELVLDFAAAHKGDQRAA
jgi:CheY-like chemotaxis protein